MSYGGVNVALNYLLDTNTANNWFSGMWALTRCMKQAGWTYQGSGDGNTGLDVSANPANDLWGTGNPALTVSGGIWSLADVYPTAFSARGTNSTQGPWWLARGPDVIKLSIPNGNVPVGTFVRGEQVSQATSGATGEILGIVYDTTSSANGGWAIILPRTGTFDATDVVTGQISSATFTPNALTTYKQEVLFWKNNAGVAAGSIYYIFDTVASGNLFSTLMVSAGVTAKIAPGGGGTGNAFPTNGIVILGSTTGTTTPTLGSQNWFNNTNGYNPSAHMMMSAVNTTPAAGVSADGTFWAIFINTQSGIVSTAPLCFLRLDDGEPGDACPFAFHTGSTTALGSFNRLSPAQQSTNAQFVWGQLTANQSEFTGYIARGTGFTTDVAAGFRLVTFTPEAFVTNIASLVQAQNYPATNKPLAATTHVLYNSNTNQQQLKGRPRWLRENSIGALFDTTDSKTWVCFLANAGTTNGGVYLGPWDGQTTPGP